MLHSERWRSRSIIRDANGASEDRRYKVKTAPTNFVHLAKLGRSKQRPYQPELALIRDAHVRSILCGAGAVAELGKRFENLLTVEFGFAFAEAGDGAQLS